MPESISTGRDESIDAIKGFLIICVVMGHFNYFLLPDIRHQEIAGRINELIYLFHMPLFLVISFVFVRPVSMVLLTQYMRQILVPYAVCVPIFFQSVMTPDSVFNKIKAVFFGTYAMGTGIFWFLTVLFVCKVIFSIHMRIVDSRAKRILFWLFFILSAVIIYFFYFWFSRPDVAALTPFNLVMCLYLFPALFLAGKIYHGRVFFRRKLSFPALFVATAATVAYVLLFSDRMPLHRLDLAAFVIPHRVDVIFMLPLLWGGMLLVLDRIFSCPTKLAAYLSRVGFYSLPIFIFHVPVKAFLENKILASVPENLIWMRVVISLVVIVATYESCIAVSWLVMSVSGRFRYMGLVKRTA